MGIFVTFVVVVLVVWAVLCWELVGEELRRTLIRWENDWNHPFCRPWPGGGTTYYGPRWGWLCKLADWLTGGACHD